MRGRRDDPGVCLFLHTHHIPKSFLPGAAATALLSATWLLPYDDILVASLRALAAERTAPAALSLAFSLSSKERLRLVLAFLAELCRERVVRLLPGVVLATATPNQWWIDM